MRNTGPGLDEEARSRVFAPFEQADMPIQRRHGGAGLGLTISRELVAVMGSELVPDSSPGQGCRFSFSLLLERAEPGTPAAAVRAASLAILVVDDIEANRIVARGLLESLGHRVLAVANGPSALEALQSGHFDAMLLDLHMQGMDGLTLLRHLRSARDPGMASLPVFLSSADTEHTRIQTCLDAGAQGVLPKPIRKERLAALFGTVAPQEVVEAPAETAWVDFARMNQILEDLGPDVWQAGLQACTDSIETSLRELEDPARVREVLHRLAGVSATFGMMTLHQLVRRAQAQCAAGSPCPVAELSACSQASLGQLRTLGADAR